MTIVRFGWIQLSSQLGQFAVAMVVIALGVALSAGMLLANSALREGFEESISALAGRADLVVHPAGGGTMGDAVLDEVRAIPGIQAAAPLVIGDVVLRDASSPRVRIIGIDMLDDATVRVYGKNPSEVAARDPLMLLSQADSAIAPRNFVERYGLTESSSIFIQTLNGPRRLTIRGIVEDAGVGSAFGGSLLIMDLFSAQAVLGMEERIAQIDVKMDSAADPDETLSALRLALPPHIAIERVAARRAALRQNVAGFQAMLNVIAAVGLLLAAIIAANRLTTMYQERMWEMGILRGLGWSPRHLGSQLLVEAGMLTLMGVAAGLAMALPFAQMIVQPVSETMALNFQATVTASNVSLDLGALSLAGVTGTLSGMAAAVLPVRRAATASIMTLRARRCARQPRIQRITGFRLLVLMLAAASFVGEYVTGSGPLGALTMVLLALAGALLIQPALRAAGALLAPFLGTAAWIGMADQARAPGRSIGAALMLMTGLALISWIENTGASFEKFIVSENAKVRRADLIIDSASNSIASSDGDLRLSEEIIAKIETVDDVEAVAGEALEKVSDPNVGIWAVDKPRFLREDFRGWELDHRALPDALTRVAMGEGVLVNDTLVANLGIGAGDQVRLVTPEGARELPVLGVTRTPFLSPGGDVVMSRDLFKRLWGRASVNRIFVLLKQGVSLERGRAEMLSLVGHNYGLRISTLEEHSAWMGENVGRAFAFLDAMALLTLAVIFVGTADALAATIRERFREIAVMRAMGFAPRELAGMVVGQALAIGIGGGLLGMLVGIGASYAFVNGVLQDVLGWRLEMYFDYRAALVATLLGASASVAGALLPATYASRIGIVRALRSE